MASGRVPGGRGGNVNEYMPRPYGAGFCESVAPVGLSVFFAVEVGEAGGVESIISKLRHSIEAPF